MQQFRARLTRFQQLLSPNQGVFLAWPSSVTYFTGLPVLDHSAREAFLYLDAKNIIVFHTPFSLPPQIEAVEYVETIHSARIVDALQEYWQTHSPKELLMDLDHLTAREYQVFQHSFSQQKLRELDLKMIWELRQQKDKTELQSLKKACQVAQKVITNVRQKLAVGMTELEVATLIDTEMRKLGSSEPAFPTIVAFGAHAALPHYQPGDIPLTAETNVLIDMGATVDGYRSDLTRSFWFGKNPTTEFRNVESVIHAAYEAALAACPTSFEEPTAVETLDQAARQTLAAQHLENYFIHTTGHGVGLDIHEPPSIRQGNPSPLLENMAITIEPGVYFPGKFGYRFENTIWLGANGPVELTGDHSPTDPR